MTSKQELMNPTKTECLGWLYGPDVTTWPEYAKDIWVAEALRIQEAAAQSNKGNAR